MSKKIYITRKIPRLASDMLTEKGFEVEMYEKEPAPSHAFLAQQLKEGQYDGVISLLTDHVDEKILTSSSQLKIVANYAVGYNNVDIKKAAELGICVTNTPGVSSVAVAEHTMALMLALTTRLVEGDFFITRLGKFKGWTPMNLLGTDLSGKTIGLVGLGNIGSAVAHMAHFGFNAKIIYHDVSKNEAVENECGAVYLDTLEKLLEEADIVSLHVPLLDSTHHLINEKTLGYMKPSAFLINTSRGPVIDEKALVTALKNKTICGAGLDVFEFEPKIVSGLKKMNNVVLTPHIASARISVRDDMARLAAQSIIDFFEGKVPKTKVS
jgi:glyoxylate reductase